MLIVKLCGGMGNQLFQYALGRYLSIKNGVPLFLDTISGFQNDFYKRKYSLNIFNIEANTFFLDEKTVQFYQRLQQPLGRKDKLWQWIFKKINQYPLFVHEKHFEFDPEMLNLKMESITLISGYWQSEKYFQEIATTIRQDFTFKTHISAQNLSLAEEIRTKNSVCLHVRRLLGIADGQINEQGVAFHGASDLTYYAKAIQFIAEKEQNIHFYIFADEPEWAQANLKLLFPTTFVKGNPDHEDLQLMALCKHYIVANSSFGWWAAWLGANPSKIVCAPDAWFADKSVNTNDIYPTSWIRL